MNNKQFNLYKESIHKNFMDNCMIQINDSVMNPKLRTYRIFKQEFKLESYIKSPIQINQTLALLRFRISAHNLAIETGRYTKPKTPADQRICLYCNINDNETEEHFLLTCTYYDNERINFLEAIRPIIPNPNFSSIMTCLDPLVTSKLAKFIHNSMEKRANINC